MYAFGDDEMGENACAEGSTGTICHYKTMFRVPLTFVIYWFDALIVSRYLKECDCYYCIRIPQVFLSQKQIYDNLCTKIYRFYSEIL